MKLFFIIVGSLFLFQACETPPPAMGPNGQNSNNQTNDDQGVIVIEIPADLKNESTEWVFSPSKTIKIPDLPIDSIIFQAPVRSVNEQPGAEAILFNVDENTSINSSLVSSNVRYTIVNYRSRNLKGYFNAGEYTLRVALRSESDKNAVSIPYECKLIIYYQL